MAKPRIFVSSTYYDLKHVRASLENFIESLGFEAILSEKGSIAYMPEVALDESCYREVTNADIFVLIIGGRYGSEKSESRAKLSRSFFDRYESITKGEYKSAAENELPIYVLVERPVYSEYETYLRNKTNNKINYAHADSVNVFILIEEILAQPKNNPVQQFDRYADIEQWLREQWAGQFRELLNRRSSQNQLSSLAAQVTAMSEISTTLKTYLEQLVSAQLPAADSSRLIKSETDRLEESKQLQAILSNSLGNFLNRRGFPPEKLREIILRSDSSEEFVDKLVSQVDNELIEPSSLRSMFERDVPQKDLNVIRKAMELKPYEFSITIDSFSTDSSRPWLAPPKPKVTKATSTSVKSKPEKVAARAKVAKSSIGRKVDNKSE